MTERVPQTISKTVFKFTVLHPTDDAPDDLMLAIARAEDDNYVGYEEIDYVERIPDDQVEDELIALGNDGRFFDFERGLSDDD